MSVGILLFLTSNTPHSSQLPASRSGSGSCFNQLTRPSDTLALWDSHLFLLCCNGCWYDTVLLSSGTNLSMSSVMLYTSSFFAFLSLIFRCSFYFLVRLQKFCSRSGYCLPSLWHAHCGCTYSISMLCAFRRSCMPQAKFAAQATAQSQHWSRPLSLNSER